MVNWFKEWFKKLEKIIEIKEIKLLSDINVGISIGKNGKEKIQALPKENKIIINFPALDKKELEETKKIFKEYYDHFEKNEIEFMETKFNERVKDIQEKGKLESTENILDFYKGKISDEYFEILEACMYLKSVYNEGKPVDDLKEDIGNTYKQIGRNMANLATTRYFEGFIKDYYEEKSKEGNFTIEKFREWFIEVVKTTPFTVFSCQEKSESQLKSEITSKLERFNKYGAEFLYVHGLGKSNVLKILNIVSKLEEAIKDIDIIVDLLGKDMNIIIVKISLKKKNTV